MKTPSNPLNKKKFVGTIGNRQALQVASGTHLAPASETTVPGPPTPADPLTKPPRHNISLDDSPRRMVPLMLEHIPPPSPPTTKSSHTSFNE
ncbi:UNVERIFIED_CONTAM: hypothetical protein Sradi_5318900 [Sesamum radiatum]|uniref:Uncharacterized protein n=1 Tax=Sesamum radiatum TaxID=300843 RepID=A0AAW2LPZ8_SESRA